MPYGYLRKFVYSFIITHISHFVNEKCKMYNFEQTCGDSEECEDFDLCHFPIGLNFTSSSSVQRIPPDSRRGGFHVKSNIVNKVCNDMVNTY